MTPASLRLSLLLAAALVAAGPQLQDSAERLVLKSVLVELESLPRSQLRGVVAAHPVGRFVELDGEPFTTELDGERLRVATRARGVPDRSLRGAEILRLVWERDGERQERELRFEPDPGGGWVFGPPRGRLFDLGGEALCIVDADLDGEFDLIHDAWSAGAGAPLLPLSQTLILGDRAFRVERLARDGTLLEGRFSPLAGNAVQHTALRRLNRLRRADGLGAVQLEPELSAGCSAHAEYLRAQSWEGAGDPHEQDPRAEQSTREGRAAARRSQILPLAPEQAVDALWATLPGRQLLCDPDLVAMGISDRELSIAVLDVSSLSTKKSLGRKAWSSPLLSPADGSRGQPTSYGQTSAGLPVEGAERMGPPLVFWLREAGADLEAYSGELFKLSGQSRRRQEVVELEALEGDGILKGVLPAKPLAGGTTYLIVHHLVVDGEASSLEVRFTTR